MHINLPIHYSTGRNKIFNGINSFFLNDQLIVYYIQHGNNPTKKTHSTRKKRSLSDSGKVDTSQSARTHYTHLIGDTSTESNISTASGHPVMVSHDSLEPVHGPRRKRQSRRRRH